MITSIKKVRKYKVFCHNCTEPWGTVKDIFINNGSGKTVSASQIPCQKRAGGGFQILKFNKNGSNGVNLICAEYTCSADERTFTVQFEDSNTEKLPISSLPKMPAASAGKGLFDWLQEITRCFVIKG